MDEMDLYSKQALMKTIALLNSFIQKRRYSNLADNVKLKIVTPVGEELEVLTAADAEKCRDTFQTMLDMERMMSL